MRPSIQGPNIPPEFYPHIRLGLRGYVEAMLRTSIQGLNIPPEFYPHIMLGCRGHVEALPTLVIIILKGYACGPQHPTWPDATRQYYSPASLPKSDPPPGEAADKRKSSCTRAAFLGPMQPSVGGPGGPLPARATAPDDEYGNGMR